MAKIQDKEFLEKLLAIMLKDVPTKEEASENTKSAIDFKKIIRTFFGREYIRLYCL